MTIFLRETRLIKATDGTHLVVMGAALDLNGLDQLFTSAHQEFNLPAKYQHGRRGDYASFGGGVSFGNGRTEPGNFAMSSHNAAVFSKVLDNPETHKLARYCDRKLDSVSSIYSG